MALIQLPDIDGIVGAVYDTEKESYQQSKGCWDWGIAIIRTQPKNESLSSYEQLGNRIRYIKSVYEYLNIRLSLEMSYVDDINKKTYKRHENQLIGTIEII